MSRIQHGACAGWSLARLWPVIVPLLVAGCGGGAGGITTSTAASTTISPAANPVDISCVAEAVHPLPVGVLINNQWNRDSAGAGSWQQCLRSRTGSTGTEVGWQWAWPAADGLYAYPEVLIGRSPWHSWASNDPRFPRTVAATQALWINHQVETASNGKQSLAAEFWLTSAPLPDNQAAPETVRAELMIWSDASPGVVATTDAPVAMVQIDGARWALYVQRDWGDASGAASNTWVLISYVAQAPSGTQRYDARKFMQDAINRGLIQPTDTIAGVEFGNEIVSGSGSTWIRQLDVQVL